ncbi:conserved hypothetical Ustilaginaceae_specific protein [Sporisorium reilianum SRZ2]|uniref:Conserved hypothetical Ustilaginaceae_specific protein n=1 Tax=Sporisorium reilianum (strain SRZ2) TaxID=999809 RepID=E7A188_SPORE|nr:conserved hypothetical Ustilaginaceae_specific protein [Sporisorium reilianum SRZ2]
MSHWKCKIRRFLVLIQLLLLLKFSLNTVAAPVARAKRAAPPPENFARVMSEEVRQAFSRTYTQTNDISREAELQAKLLHQRLEMVQQQQRKVPKEPQALSRLVWMSLPSENHYRVKDYRSKSFSA